MRDEYAGGVVSNIDYVNISHFSMQQLDLMVKALGYTRVEYFTVFFRIPTLSMKYGVVVIEFEEDINAVPFQAREFPEISLYFQREYDSTFNPDSLFGQRWLPGQHGQGDTTPSSSDDDDIDEAYLSDARSYIKN